MAWGVTKWGYSPDPRPPDFASTGFAFGALPPYRWTMLTSGALAPYLALNLGVTWTRASDSINSAVYLPVVPIPDVTDPILNFAGTNAPVGGFTIEWFLEFFGSGDPSATRGTITELYPDAIEERSFAMVNLFGGPPFFPNPLVITPHKWNAP